MERKTIAKVILGILIFLIGTIGAIAFTSYLDALIMNKQINMSIFKIPYIQNLLNNPKALKLFYSFELLVLLMSIFLVVKNDKFYESNMIKITPKIKIPVAAGQMQFGSARFMTVEEKEEQGVLYIRKKDNKIKKIINQGYDDLKEGDDYYFKTKHKRIKLWK